MSFNLLHYLGIQSISISLVIDIISVGCLLYGFYKFIEGSIAVKIATGLLVVYFLYLIVSALRLTLLTTVFTTFIDTGPILLVILFQREARQLLSGLGKGLLSSKEIILHITPWLRPKKVEIDVTPVVKAAQILGGSNTGALIVFTKDGELRHYEESGDLINAVVSARLLIAIFNKHSPLHDGAVIIHQNRIVAARCILPVTEVPNIAACFGLRHKAAIGLTEVTDALVLIVSEESGQISIARKGKMENNLSAQAIRSAIKEYLSNNLVST